MEKVRIGMVGCGGIGQVHFSYLNQVKGAELTAVCDIDPAPLKAAMDKMGVPGFEDYRALVDSGLCDAIIIGTPHYFHPEIMMYAFGKGLHVLSEKPVGVHVNHAKAMIATAAKHPDLVFGVMFQSRTRPYVKKAKEMVDSGELGRLLRATCLETTWYRTQAYYDSGGWRATWGGEGGGVLLNQCPHTLDVFTYLAGSPKRVIAMVKLGNRHNIEVEDEVSAILEYENGAFGQFITSTGEAPGSSILELAFDRGLLRLEEGKVLFRRNRIPTFEHLKTSQERFEKPERWDINLPLGPAPSGSKPHQPITQNFVNAILKGEKLIAPGQDGIHGLELGNAILMSGLSGGKPVDLPLDGDAMEALIKDLCAKSTFVKPETKKASAADMTSSFH